MKKSKVVLVNPTVLVDMPRSIAVAPRLASLRGKAVGVLWNEKPNGDILLAKLEGRLRDSFDLSQKVWLNKRPAAPASREVVDELAARVDFVVSGVCD
ncbi:MAG: hypothetical protein ABIH46_00085 [Chloroflexota bacterium]